MEIATAAVRGAGSPVLAAGKSARGQHFDGVQRYFLPKSSGRTRMNTPVNVQFPAHIVRNRKLQPVFQ